VVAAAVRNIDDDAINPLPRHRGAAAGHAKRLLAVLSWSYAHEIYSSAQIVACLDVSQTGEMWGGGAPDWAEIQRFRAENRSALQICLLAALRFLAAQKVAAGVVTRINESWLAAEAARRIVAAMFTDSVEPAMPLSGQQTVRC
jgi:hypothetical protein